MENMLGKKFQKPLPHPTSPGDKKNHSPLSAQTPRALNAFTYKHANNSFSLMPQFAIQCIEHRYRRAFLGGPKNVS